MPTDHRAELAKIKSFPQLIAYLRDEMGWPIARDSFDDVDDLFYDFSADELGIDTKNAAKIQEIKRLRPLSPRQPWGIFFVKFEPKKLPVVALRRILSQVALKKRASANSAERTAWAADDLLFVSNYGAGDERQISFAHFSQAESKHDLPTLKVLGWDNRDTALHLDHVADEMTTKLAWPKDDRDVEVWRNTWRSAFTLRPDEVIKTSKALAVELAKLAQKIRDTIRTVLKIETEHGPLTKLLKAFQEALVHDLNPEGFADMYAQTITYGLLSARITDPHKKTVDDFAGHMRTNPFLRELMETFLHVGGRHGKAGGPGIDFDELGVSEVVELLDDANMEAVVRDFGDLNPQEDPVIRFYEDFLREYDPKEKKQRGVFYTPRPVVCYIVRSVHELLQTEFGLADGLADTATWGDIVQRFPGLAFPEGMGPSDRFVTVLDVATGTGTFLVVVIEVIYNTLVEKWKREGHNEKKILDLWNDYVPKHLLPRLYGYELLMAPYAIAHLKVGLKLYETGYRFESEERARIYLTNSLEPAHDFSGTFEFAIPALAHEAKAVSEIKRTQRFTVVIGNPPYSVNSANKNSPMDAHLTEYKRDLTGERNLKPLNDDYVKFMRFSHMALGRTGCGVLGMITNHSYTTARLFRSMRRSLLQDFNSVKFLDLRGDMGRDPQMARDQNVFDIQQGVGIAIFSRTTSTKSTTLFAHRYELRGDREYKYTWLGQHSGSSTPWIVVSPPPPLYGFGQVEQNISAEYDAFLPLNRIFGVGNVGYQTHRDDFVIDFKPEGVISRIASFREARGNERQLSERFGVYNNRDWSLLMAHKALVQDTNWESRVQPTLYRPFDVRQIVYASYLIDYDRSDLMGHMTSGNKGLLVSKVFDEHEFTSVLATKWIVESKVADRTRGSHLFPLRLSSEAIQMRLQGPRTTKWMTNLGDQIHTWLKQRFGITVCLNDRSVGPKEVLDKDIFGYIYGVLHSPAYRSRYADFLKDDFPRVPLSGAHDLFRDLARFGSELVALHLLESPKLDQPITEFIGGRNPEVEKVSWSKNSVWVDKAQTAGFTGVPEDVWNLHIGGYQVCEKWLKDRRGRTLSKDDIAHYQKVIVALNETIRIMKEIDEVIDKHGGWPGAFSTASAREPLPISNKVVVNEVDPSVREYGVGDESLPLAAEAGSPFGGDIRPVTSDNRGNDVTPPSPTEKKIEASADTDSRNIDDIEQSEIMAAIRQIFSDGAARDRETAIRDVTRALGFDRACSRIQERLDGELIAAVRRSIVVNEKGDLSLRSRNIEDYSREYLKTLFLIDMGSVWWDRADAINKATRYLGFTRTGSKIYDSFKSIISGLIREGKLESDPDKGIRRA